ncbi:hypothetical protein YC2023_007764 [Brassica napus]
MSKEAQVRYMQHHSGGLQSLGHPVQAQRSYVGEPSTSWNASPTIDDDNCRPNDEPAAVFAWSNILQGGRSGSYGVDLSYSNQQRLTQTQQSHVFHPGPSSHHDRGTQHTRARARGRRWKRSMLKIILLDILITHGFIFN